MNIYQPFTYLIKFKPTGELYYGVRYKQGCEPKDLWDTYYTSSKRVRQLLKEHGADAFEVSIRRTFTNKESAILWEHTVLRRLNAAQHPQFLNENNGNRQFFGGGVRKGFKHTEETKRKMAASTSGENNPNWGGKAFTEESRRKLSEAKKDKNYLSDKQREEYRERWKIDNPMRRKKYYWWNNGIEATLSDVCPGEDWVRGRLSKEGHREKMEKARWSK
jgi:hypothetical protein